VGSHAPPVRRRPASTACTLICKTVTHQLPHLSYTNTHHPPPAPQLPYHPPLLLAAHSLSVLHAACPPGQTRPQHLAPRFRKWRLFLGRVAGLMLSPQTRRVYAGVTRGGLPAAPETCRPAGCQALSQILCCTLFQGYAGVALATQICAQMLATFSLHICVSSTSGW
jgi:hypothetical protein